MTCINFVINGYEEVRGICHVVLQSRLFTQRKLFVYMLVIEFRLKLN